LIKLDKYITFCIDNNTNNSVKSDLHHILPKSQWLFPQFADLKNNCWNGTYLTPINHIKAHKLLAEAINHLSIDKAFTCLYDFSYDVSNMNEDEINDIIIRGRKHSEETKQKISKSNTGKSRLKGESSPNFGNKHSDETKKKMSNNHADVSGDKNPMYGCNRSGEAGPNFGNKHSDEAKKKMSNNRKNKGTGKRAGYIKKASVCIICGLISSSNTISKYHNAKCKGNNNE